jgi:hypothetical protein
MKNPKSTDKGLAYWRAHVKAQRKSGLTQREYCRQNDISYWSYNPWKRKLEGRGDLFYEISPKIIQDLTVDNKNIEITVNDNIKISIPEGFSTDTLRDILHVLEAV